MAKVKITLYKREGHKHKDGRFPLVLRISHKSKTRDIPLDINVYENQFNEVTGKFSGIQNQVRNTKRIQKLFGDVDLWIDENKSKIKLWDIGKLKDKLRGGS